MPNMQPPPIKDYALNNIIPGEANSRPMETPTKGNFFYIISASHSRFSIEINDGGAAFSGSLVRGHIFPVDFDIEKIRIQNNDTGGINLSVVVQVGRGEPINHLFNVSTDEITPTLRSDTPFITADIVKTAPADLAVDTWTLFAAADEFRRAIWLKTDAASGGAFWASGAAPGAANEFFSRDIKDTADASGFLKLETTAAIYIRLKTNHSVRAINFKYAV